MTFFFKSRKPAKLCESLGVSLEVVETEIKATEELLKKYRNNGYDSALTCVREMPLQIDSWFAESRPRKRKMKQRTKVVKCHKKANLKQISFCH